jgi:hypothetical protein
MYLTYVDVEWPIGFINFFRWTGIANLMILELAPLDCITGSRISYYSKITFHTLIMPMVALIFVTVYVSGLFILKWCVVDWLKVPSRTPQRGREGDPVQAVELACYLRQTCSASPCPGPKCTTPSLRPTVNGHTVRSFSRHGQQSAAQGSSTTCLTL